MVQPSENVHVERGGLYVRPHGTQDEFTQLELTALGGDLFATIPGESVTERGIEYYVEVENHGVFRRDPPEAPSLGHVLEVDPPTSIVTVPQNNHGESIVADLDVSILSLMPTGAVFESGWLFWRQGGAASYDSTAIQQETGILRAVVPASGVTARGFEYWVRIRTASGVELTDPPQGTSSSPSVVAVRVPSLLEPRSHPGSRYRILSIPLVFPGEFTGTIESMLDESGDLGPYEPTQWRVFRYLPGQSEEEQGRNVELTVEPNLFRPEPGRAFWLATRHDHRVDTYDVTGLSTTTAAPFPVVIMPGWNQFGNPFDFPVAWSAVQHSEKVGLPVAFDSTRGQKGGYSPDDVVALIPFEGYFIYSSSAEPDTLLVPPMEAPASLLALMSPRGTVTSSLAKKLDDLSYWSLNVSAITAESEDRTLVLGVRSDAGNRFDASDRRKPPAVPGPWVELAVDHSDWGTHSGRYRHDFRAPSPEGHRWDLVLRTEHRGQEVLLRGWAEANVPEEVDLRLVDLEQRTSLEIRHDTSYRVLSFGPSRDYRLAFFAGTPEYVERGAEDLAEVPPTVVMDQNVPNPFNPFTRVRFGLPRSSRVLLVIYDIRGKQINTLVDSEILRPGFHTRIWDGRDLNGSRVASGVYLVHLVTELATTSRKMVLLR